ncbi:MAG: cobalt ECF transporter T component CbiQ [Chromatiales bacterium]|jgi:cobalt/nickel transport system permease protein|nr:cobalt ECF transporter T component CbiQ [Chromatiales bacterium]
MSQVLQVDSHAPSNDLLAGVDARVRIVVSVTFALSVVSFTNVAALVAAVAVAVLALLVTGVPKGPTLKRVMAMDGFVIMVLIMLPFTMPGDTLFSVFGLNASSQGLVRAIEIGLKANAVVLLLLVLVGSLEPVEFGYALHRLRVPTTLVHLLMFTVRYVDVLDGEYRRLRIAMKARGFRPTNCWHTYRTLGYLIGMMLIRAMERSERILAAMKCRGFSGKIHLLEPLPAGNSSGIFVAISMVTLVLLITMNSLYVSAS